MINNSQISLPLSLRSFLTDDPFWSGKMELIRTRVIPYQWRVLNDRVEGAAPSYCIHNFKAAAVR